MKLGIEATWKFMLDSIYFYGKDHIKDDSLIREEIGLRFRITNPLIEKTPTALSISPQQFLKMISDGVFDIDNYPIKGEALADYVSSIYHRDKIAIHDFDPNKQFTNSFVYTYPERLEALWINDRECNIEPISQLDVICRRLEQNLGSNRAIAVLYQAGFDSTEVDIPCLQLIQALVRDDKLILVVFFRSNDIYGAFPSNMLFISNIGLMIQERLNKTYPNVRFDHIEYHVSSAHIYKTDLNAVKRIIEQE